jgi:hypothetical protein
MADADNTLNPSADNVGKPKRPLAVNIDRIDEVAADLHKIGDLLSWMRDGIETTDDRDDTLARVWSMQWLILKAMECVERIDDYVADVRLGVQHGQD